MKHLKRTLVAAFAAAVAFGAAGQASALTTEQAWRDCKAKVGSTTKSCCTELSGEIGSELKWNPYKQQWESVPTCTINGTVYTLEGTDGGTSEPRDDYWYDGSSSGTYQQPQYSSTSTTGTSSGTYSR